MKLRAPVDDQGEPLEPFERPPAVWTELGAPPELVDAAAAAAAELAAHGAVLAPDEPGSPGPAWFYARRWWRRARPAFLAERGALTAAEAAMLGARSRRAAER